MPVAKLRSGVVMRLFGSARDPLWYKDAIIYELHVKAFFDSRNKGVGDFGGLIQKLDYIQDLGVTCLWLLPFFPSPLKDDGYDISDYVSIHPSYGTMEDFRAFLKAAHDRNLQVMIELVMNHTSDQHPWFEAARSASPGSPQRDFYVWSDTDQKYREARIIFTDTEKSNWTWDPVAKSYFWHRFFSHQPDLNYDNPEVLQEMLRVMRFWLDMGVDGLRLDAIPYLVERDGTNCENLPETHAVIKAIRAEMDRHYANRMILAEANQWPSDVRPYFGDGDECHMAFHFPLMPRIFMALRLEDRLPIIEIMKETPPIPESCQWGLFLRNHDELTLEMVSDDERDYMYFAYSADPRMRVNIGIRRRLAPLMNNNRRRIELLNSLLFSFPGTPIVYYGDEMGMGDNIYLGDRNGVRTPMQWTGDRNGGFSRANPAQLYSPVIMDPVYGYEAINVEAQHSDPSSLLNWMRNMIALRKLFRVFGRGTLEFLQTANRKILAYLRKYEGEQVLCVANLSRFAQPVELDLSGLEGFAPTEMLGFVEFPKIGRRPYPLTLAPYGFLWFELHGEPEPVEISSAGAEEVTDQDMMFSGDWAAFLDGPARQTLETRILPEFLPRQRWFGGKTKEIVAASLIDWAEIEEAGSPTALLIVDVHYREGEPDTYFLPLTATFGQDATALRESAAIAVLSPIVSEDGPGVLHDALFDESSCAAMLSCIAEARQIRTPSGIVSCTPSSAFASARGAATEPLLPRRAAAEQSNSSIIYGDRLILKLFRRQEPGPNPDCELGRYLTEKAHFTAIPPFAGAIEYRPDGSESRTLAMLQGLVDNQGDGWTWTLEELNRYYESCASDSFPSEYQMAWDEDVLELSERSTPEIGRQYVGIMLDEAAALGRRTAEMHVALAQPAADPEIAPEPMMAEDFQRVSVEVTEHARRVFTALKDALPRLPDDVVELAGSVLSRRRAFLEQFRKLQRYDVSVLRTRIHGDYHLGQVLRVKGDYVILDFEGEPARPLAERRAKYSPLKDVAGMLRSFSYAAWAALLAYTERRSGDLGQLEPWARLWEREISAQFLRVYRRTAGDAAFLPNTTEALRTLLDTYLMDKALYELSYELNNRPGWVQIPLRGALSFRV
jgi:maltose alpha-D-glucosyltransferase/alpha-amylase